MVAIETEHRQVQASRREATTTEEEHHRQQLFKEAENRPGVRVLVHRHRTATHFPNVQTVFLLDLMSHELVVHLHLHQQQRAEPMSIHIFHRTKVARVTTAARHHATAATEIEIETATCTIEVDEAIVATQTARDTTTQTPRLHGSIVMQTRPVVEEGHHLATPTEIVAILLHEKTRDGPEVEVLIENDASDCRIESAIFIGDDLLERTVAPLLPSYQGADQVYRRRMTDREGERSPWIHACLLLLIRLRESFQRGVQWEEPSSVCVFWEATERRR